MNVLSVLFQGLNIENFPNHMHNAFKPAVSSTSRGTFIYERCHIKMRIM